MTAPTDQDIREAIAAEAANDQVVGYIDDAIGFASTFTSKVWLWEELRKSEQERLSEILEQHLDILAVECRAAIVARFTVAARQFAAEYPDAPRAREKVPA